MQTNDVIEYTDSDGHQRRVVVGELLSAEESKVDDDDLACTLTGAINADVSLYLTPLDLAADAARQEAYDQAVSSLEFTIDRILAGRDESDIPVYDDNPDDLVGEWIYTGDPETGPRLCYRWHAELPAEATFDDQTFVTNSADGDWGDVEDTAIDLNPDQRRKVAAWVAGQVADDYTDRVAQAAADVNAARELLDLLLLDAVKAGASGTGNAGRARWSSSSSTTQTRPRHD